MRAQNLFPILLVLSAFSVDAQTITSVAAGSAQTAATWDCNCVPPNSADLVVGHNVTLSVFRRYHSMTINGGGSFLKQGTGDLSLTGDLTINAGGTLTNNSNMQISGNYYNAGVHNGNKTITLDGTNTSIGGTPTAFINNTGNMVLKTGDKNIFGGNVITKNNGRVQVQGITVHNHGAFQVGELTASGSNSTWIQHAGSWLGIRRSLAQQLILNASAVGNDVLYNGPGAGTQIVRAPLGGSYFNLVLSSNTLSNKKVLQSNITVLNDLQITTCTFDVRRAGQDHDVVMGGNWTNTGASFKPRSGEVIFQSTAMSTITHASEEIFYDLTVAGSGMVMLASDIQVKNDLLITSTLDAGSGVRSIKVGGDWTNNGTFARGNGRVIFNGMTVQTINGTTYYNDLTIQKNGTATMVSGVQGVHGTLTLTHGTLQTGGLLGMISDANGDSRIAPVVGNITGSAWVQRYIDAGATNWRFLTSAVSGRTIGDWQDDFVTSGYVGSHWPGFPFTSIYFYNEAAAGTEDDGFVAATNSTNAIGMGQGLWVWCGDSLGGTAPFTIDVQGPIYKGQYNLPMTFTSFGSAVNDGWNMVANPYVSVIDWDSPNWTKTHVNNAVYIWNPDAQNFAGYVGGVGVNGGSRYIASSQAFWVQANAASPQLTIRESCKTPTAVGFKDDTPMDLLRLRVVGNGAADETVLRLMSGTSPQFDTQFDAYEQWSANTMSPNICSKMPDGSNLMVNTVAPFAVDTTYQVKVKVGTNATYQIQFTEITGAFAAMCLTLEDVVLGQTVPVVEGGSYSFTMGGNYNGTRFRLHSTAPMAAHAEGTSCSYSTDGQAWVSPTGVGPYTYNWFDPNGDLVQTHTLATTDSLTNAMPGTYTVTVDGQGGCGQLALEIEHPAPAPIEAQAILQHSTCNGSADGAIDLTVSGGTAPYQYAWSTGAATEDVASLTPGNYSVDVIDANLCLGSHSFNIAEQTSVQAAFVAPAQADAGDPIVFDNTSIGATDHAWILGDGSTSTDASPVHVYDLPGNYTVTLTASTNDCSDVTTHAIEILATTGINGLADPEGIDIVEANGTAYLLVGGTQARDLELRVDNLLGQQLMPVISGRREAGRSLIRLPQGQDRVLVITVRDLESGEQFTRRLLH